MRRRNRRECYSVSDVRLQTVESEPRDRYRRLVELSPDGILISQDNRLVFVNPAAMRLFGASAPEQILGKSPFDVLPRPATPSFANASAG